MKYACQNSRPATDHIVNLGHSNCDWGEPGAALSGVIYLDNSDKGLDETTGDIPEARRLLLAFAEREGLPACEFTDFAPTQLHVQRGLWVGPRP